MSVEPPAQPPADAEPAAPTAPPAPARTFWQRRVRDPILAQLKQGATPDKIALTVAVGVACGLFPFLGFTTFLCLAIAAVLRLNQPVIHLVNQVLWPVHVPAMAAYFFIARWLESDQPLSYDTQEMINYIKDLAALFTQSQAEFWQRFGLISLFALVAWLVTIPFIIAGIYYPLRPVLRKLAALRQARALKGAE